MRKEKSMSAWRCLSWRTIAGMALFVGAVGDARPAGAQDILEWAKEHTAKWYAAFNAGDPSAMAQLYASDAVLLLQGETFSGRGEIEKFHAGNFAKVRYSCTWSISSVSMVDHLAAVWGDDACVETPKSGAPPQMWQGRWLTVYQLQPDGSWLIVRDSGEEAK
jgi:uncharacterized protein (TIGR02246 family)